MITDVERDTDVPAHRSPAPSVVPTLISARFPGRSRAAGWPATMQGREQVLDRLTRTPFLLDSAGAQKERRRGLVALLDWLGAQPGESWQDRWLAGGADTAGADWRQIPARWLRAAGRPAGLTDPLCAALTVAVCADVLRPSTAWFVAAVPPGGALARGMALTRDPAGFARLRQVCDRGDDHLPAAVGRHTLHRAAVVLGAHGGLIADVTVGDVLELLDAESAAHRSPMAHGVAFYRALHQSGILGPDVPARLEELRSAGQRTPAELIDRFDLACRPIRDLLVDYLSERQPRLDYSSVRSLAADLGNVFWKDLERHHPGIDSLHLAPAVATAWKQRLRTRRRRPPPPPARRRPSPWTGSATASA